MKKFLCLMIILFLAGTAQAQLQPWQASPHNWQNNPHNFDNSPQNWKNSPQNWQNRPENWTAPNRIYDPTGQPRGYYVPRQDGGVNIYDFGGNRKGYVPGRGW
jgi:hypothetical protein